MLFKLIVSFWRLVQPLLPTIPSGVVSIPTGCAAFDLLTCSTLNITGMTTSKTLISRFTLSGDATLTVAGNFDVTSTGELQIDGYSQFRVEGI